MGLRGTAATDSSVDFEPHRLSQHPPDPAGEVDRFFVDALPLDQHGELVAA